MRRRARVARRFLPLAILLAALAGSAARAADAPGDLVLVGADGAAHRLAAADLAALPATEREVTFQGEHGTLTARFAGPLLWRVLIQAGALTPEPRAHVRMTVTTTGADGYSAVLALGEIDPAFEGKEVLLATRQDGQPLGGTGLRQIVPGDKRGGRSVRDVVRIAVGPGP